MLYSLVINSHFALHAHLHMYADDIASASNTKCIGGAAKRSSSHLVGLARQSFRVCRGI